MELLEVVIFSLVLSVVLAEQMLINDVIDKLLLGVKSAIVEQGKDTIRIEDLHHDWQYRWHFVKFKGTVKCSDGKLDSLSSIRRTGDSYYRTEGNRMGISFALGLERLSLTFKCRITARHIISFRQTIKVTADYNSVVGDVSLARIGDSCDGTVERLQIDHLDGVRIRTGGGIIHKIEDRLLNLMYRHFHGSVVRSVSNELKKTASSHFVNQNWCKDLPRLNATIS